MTHSPENFAQLACLIHTCDETHSNVWYGCMWAFCANHATHLCVGCDTLLSMTWRIHICDMTHSCVWNEAFLYVTWPIPMCYMTHSHTWLDVFFAYGMTHSDVFNDPYMEGSCTRNISDSHMWQDSFLCVPWMYVSILRVCVIRVNLMRSRIHGTLVTWIISMRDMTHSFVWHGSLLGVAELTRVAECDVMWRVGWLFHKCGRTRWKLIHIWSMTHLLVWHDPFTWRSGARDMAHTWYDMTHSC